MSEKLDCFAALANAYADWLKLPFTGIGRRNHLRFGQYVWNRFHWDDRSSWPELFHETNEHAAYSLLFNHIHNREKV